MFERHTLYYCMLSLHSRYTEIAFGLLLLGGGVLGVFLTVLMLLWLISSRELPPFERPSSIAELRACEGKPVEATLRLWTEAELRIPALGVRENALSLSYWAFTPFSARQWGLPSVADSTKAQQIRCSADDSGEYMPVEISHVCFPEVAFPASRLHLPSYLEETTRVLSDDFPKLTLVQAERYLDPNEPTTDPRSGDAELQLSYTPSGALLLVRGKVKDGVLHIDSRNGWAEVWKPGSELPRRIPERGRRHALGLACFGAVAAPVLLAAGLLMLRLCQCFGAHRVPYWRTVGLLILLIAGVSVAVLLLLWQEYRFLPCVQWGLVAAGAVSAAWALWRLRY